MNNNYNSLANISFLTLNFLKENRSHFPNTLKCYEKESLSLICKLDNNIRSRPERLYDIVTENKHIKRKRMERKRFFKEKGVQYMNKKIINKILKLLEDYEILNEMDEIKTIRNNNADTSTKSIKESEETFKDLFINSSFPQLLSETINSRMPKDPSALANLSESSTLQPDIIDDIYQELQKKDKDGTFETFFEQIGASKDGLDNNQPIINNNNNNNDNNNNNNDNKNIMSSTKVGNNIEHVESDIHQFLNNNLLSNNKDMTTIIKNTIQKISNPTEIFAHFLLNRINSPYNDATKNLDKIIHILQQYLKHNKNNQLSENTDTAANISIQANIKNNTPNLQSKKKQLNKIENEISKKKKKRKHKVIVDETKLIAGNKTQSSKQKEIVEQPPSKKKKKSSNEIISNKSISNNTKPQINSSIAGTEGLRLLLETSLSEFSTCTHCKQLIVPPEKSIQCTGNPKSVCKNRFHAKCLKHKKQSKSPYFCDTCKLTNDVNKNKIDLTDDHLEEFEVVELDVSSSDDDNLIDTVDSKTERTNFNNQKSVYNNMKNNRSNNKKSNDKKSNDKKSNDKKSNDKKSKDKKNNDRKSNRHHHHHHREKSNKTKKKSSKRMEVTINKSKENKTLSKGLQENLDIEALLGVVHK